LDLFCRARGISEGLRRAGFDVVGVDILDCAKAYNKGPGNPAHENPARFVQADALSYPLEGFDLICASPPCQAHSALRHLQKGKEYPELIPRTRARETFSTDDAPVYAHFLGLMFLGKDPTQLLVEGGCMGSLF
jgi:DNA (cytosine-5)-methyltransferase 1